MQVVFVYKLYIRDIHAQYHFLSLSMNTPFPVIKIAYVYANNKPCFISLFSLQIFNLLRPENFAIIISVLLIAIKLRH